MCPKRREVAQVSGDTGWEYSNDLTVVLACIRYIHGLELLERSAVAFWNTFACPKTSDACHSRCVDRGGVCDADGGLRALIPRLDALGIVVVVRPARVL